MEALRSRFTLLYVVVLFLYTSVVTSLNGPPQITRKYEVEYNLRTGENLHIRCPLHSQPVSHYKWMKNGMTITSAWASVKIRDDVLNIKGVEKSDSGDYICVATNGFGTNKVDFSVCVQGNDSTIEDDTDHCTVSPSFLQDPGSFQKKIDVAVGEPALLSCTSRGKPRPDIKWTKDGNYVSDRNPDRFIFTLQRVTKQDGGQYICHVYNSAGSVNRTFTVTVKDVLNEPGETPWFFPSVMNNVTVNIGGTARFSCQIYSQDEGIQIWWVKRAPHTGSLHGADIAAIKEVDVIQTGFEVSKGINTVTSTLTIDRVATSDIGLYACVTFKGQSLQAQEASLRIPFDSHYAGGGSPSEDGTQQYLPIVVAVGAVTGIVVLALVIWLTSRRCAAASSSKRTPSSTASTTSSPHNSAGASSAAKSNLSGPGSTPRAYPGYGPVPSGVEHPAALMQGYIQPQMAPQPPLPYPLHQQHLIQQQQRLLQQPPPQGEPVQFQYYEQC